PNIRANYANRDEVLEDDLVYLHIDTLNTKKSGFVFGVNPRGIQVDGKIDQADVMDYSWDAVYRSAGMIDKDGWTAELAIPFKNLRFATRDKKQDWGMLVTRDIPSKSEHSTWPPLSLNIDGSMQQAGRLEGLEILPTHSFSATPYAAGGYQGELNGAGTSLDHEGNFDAGVDFKYAYRSNLVVDLAVNPDFSQIEADAGQLEINRRYELYFPEKRPFFLEGAEIFNTHIPVFYSRRIANPLGGLKLTGKTDSYSYGVISSYDEGVDGGPDAYYNILRFKNDFADQSSIGLIYTDKEYKGTQTGEYLYNRVAGLDTTYRFQDYYTFYMQGLYSWTEAETADGVETTKDPALYAKLKRSDGKLTLSFVYKDLPPSFNAEAGFLEKPAIRGFGLYGEYKFLPETVIRSATPFILQEVILDHDDTIQQTRHAVMALFDLEGQHQVEPCYELGIENWRGKQYLKNEVSAFYQNTASKYFAGMLLFRMGQSIFYDKDHFADPADEDDSFLGWRYALQVMANVKPVSNLNIELSATWENLRKSAGGEEVYDVWLLRGIVNYQIIPKLFARVIADQNTFDDTLSFSALLGYVYQPGTAVYLGYNEDVSYDGGVDSTGRTIFAKLSYNWQGSL
ncbi:MAG: DUF5916 domain-containing protein, partial [Candidatus Margulisiibacteriota bacterium]